MNFAPPAPPLHLSDPRGVTSVRFMAAPPGWNNRGNMAGNHLQVAMTSVDGDIVGLNSTFWKPVSLSQAR
jgi:hypothetical protein